MRRFNPNIFYTWFQPVNIEYLECVNEELCDTLSTLDINNSWDQDEVIKIAILPEFIKWDEVSKKLLKQALVDIDQYPEAGIREVIQTSNLPFDQELIDYNAFFKKVLHAIEQL